jgi:hypothetical protein
MTMHKVLIAFLLTTVSLWGADFAGTWKGPFALKAANGTVIDEGTAVLHLKQQGDTITGDAMTGDGEVLTLTNGKAEDGAPIAVRLTLDAEGQLTGQAQGEVDGQKVTGELKLRRQ